MGDDRAALVAKYQRAAEVARANNRPRVAEAAEDRLRQLGVEPTPQQSTPPTDPASALATKPKAAPTEKPDLLERIGQNKTVQSAAGEIYDSGAGLWRLGGRIADWVYDKPMKALGLQNYDPTVPSPPPSGTDPFWQAVDPITRPFKAETAKIVANIAPTEADSPEHKQFQDDAEAFAEGGSSSLTMGGSTAVLDHLEPQAPYARRNIYTDPNTGEARGATPRLAGAAAGAIGSAIAGPARVVDRAVRGVAGSIGKGVASVAPKVAASPATKSLGQYGTDIASAATQTGAQNVAEGLDPGSNMALALSLGILPRFVGNRAKDLRTVLEGPPGRPTQAGRYRQTVPRLQHRKVEGPGLTGVPAPEDVAASGKVDPNHPAAMRDSRDAAEYAGTSAMTHRATKAKTNLDARETEMAPYLEDRASRDAIIRDIDQQLAENKDLYLGTVDDSLQSELTRARTKLEETRPAPQPVNPGAPQMAQVDAHLPATEPIPQPPPPLEVPKFSGEQRAIDFPQPPPPEGPFGPQPTPPATLPDHTGFQERIPFDAPGPYPPQPQAGQQLEIDAPPQPPPVPEPPLFPPRQDWMGNRTGSLDPAGQQLEINAPPPPAPTPGTPETGAPPEPYQREMRFAQPDDAQLSLEEALGDPTIGGLRRLRAQARQRAGFENPNPTPAERDARNAYFIWDRAIKRSARPEYLKIEEGMATDAANYRKEGDSHVQD